jgi:hypothetical protein
MIGIVIRTSLQALIVTKYPDSPCWLILKKETRTANEVVIRDDLYKDDVWTIL